MLFIFLLSCSGVNYSPPTVKVVVDYSEIEAVWYPSAQER